MAYKLWLSYRFSRVLVKAVQRRASGFGILIKKQKEDG
jgi:hypothetical protein